MRSRGISAYHTLGFAMLFLQGKATTVVSDLPWEFANPPYAQWDAVLGPAVGGSVADNDSGHGS